MATQFRLLILLLFSAPLLAQQEAAIAPVDPASSLYLVKITLGLVFIILLIFGLAWLARKMQLTPMSGQQLIRILSVAPVGNRDRIALVEVGDEQILIGMSPGRIQTLHVLNSKLQVNEQSARPQPFAEKFARLMDKNGSDAVRRDDAGKGAGS